MKKRILTLLLTLAITITFGQGKLLGILPLKNGKVIYTDVVQVDSISKDDLYKQIKHWFIDTYKSANQAIQLDDKENGEIISEGFFNVYWNITFYTGQSINIWHTIKVQIKDGRYRYEITDFKVNYILSITNPTYSPLEVWNTKRAKNCKKIYAQIDNKIQLLIISLKKFVQTQPKNDW